MEPAITPPPYHFALLSLFPAMFDGLRQESLIGKAIEAGIVEIAVHNWRLWTTDRHQVVDDEPFGGGPGMVIKPEPLLACLRQVRARLPAGTRTVLLSPAGQLFRQETAIRWSQGPGVVLLCGRYEGFDARIEAHVDEIVSIGDYVLNGGEVAAMAIIEAVARLLPGVVGNAASLQDESHSAGLLEHPHYTRPREFEGVAIPEVLTSGHHAEIARWRLRQSLLRTWQRRPELLQGYKMNKKDAAWLAERIAELTPQAEPKGAD